MNIIKKLKIKLIKFMKNNNSKHNNNKIKNII